MSESKLITTKILLDPMTNANATWLSARTGLTKGAILNFYMETGKASAPLTEKLVEEAANWWEMNAQRFLDAEVEEEE